MRDPLLGQGRQLVDVSQDADRGGTAAELFQWLPAEKAEELTAVEPLHRRVGEELADVLLYLVRLADVIDVELFAAASAKLTRSEGRFVATDVRGKAPEKT